MHPTAIAFSKVLCRIARAVHASKEYSLGLAPDCRPAAPDFLICDAAHSESAGRVTFAKIDTGNTRRVPGPLGFRPQTQQSENPVLVAISEAGNFRFQCRNSIVE